MNFALFNPDDFSVNVRGQGVVISKFNYDRSLVKPKCYVVRLGYSRDRPDSLETVLQLCDLLVAVAVPNVNEVVFTGRNDYWDVWVENYR